MGSGEVRVIKFKRNVLMRTAVTELALKCQVFGSSRQSWDRDEMELAAVVERGLDRDGGLIIGPDLKLPPGLDEGSVGAENQSAIFA